MATLVIVMAAAAHIAAAILFTVSGYFNMAYTNSHIEWDADNGHWRQWHITRGRRLALIAANVVLGLMGLWLLSCVVYVVEAVRRWLRSY